MPHRPITGIEITWQLRGRGFERNRASDGLELHRGRKMLSHLITS
jgi:hypothetical protein